MGRAVRQAGQLDRRVTILRAAVNYSEFNEPIQQWAPLCTLWARKEDLQGAESYRAGEVAAQILTRFVVRWSPATADITPLDRLVFLNQEYDITAAVDLERNQWRQLDVVARPDASNLPGTQ